MTDTQIKQLAEMVLIDNEKIEVIASILTQFIERKISEGDDFEGRALSLIHHIEQLSALDQAAATAREQMRKEFGL